MVSSFLLYSLHKCYLKKAILIFTFLGLFVTPAAAQVFPIGSNGLKLTDADGTQATFKLQGPGGSGQVVVNGSQWDVQVSSTKNNTQLSITTNGQGNGRVTIHDIQ